MDPLMETILSSDVTWAAVLSFVVVGGVLQTGDLQACCEICCDVFFQAFMEENIVLPHVMPTWLGTIGSDDVDYSQDRTGRLPTSPFDVAAQHWKLPLAEDNSLEQTAPVACFEIAEKFDL